MNLPKNLAENIQLNKDAKVPKMYGIVDLVRIQTSPDQADCFEAYLNGDSLDKDEIEGLLELYEIKDYDICRQIEIIQDIEPDMVIVPIVSIPQISNFAPFLSEAAAKEHLEKHGHHYHEKAHIVELDLFRNPELREALIALYDYLEIV